jgi:hypothetical protein
MRANEITTALGVVLYSKRSDCPENGHSLNSEVRTKPDFHCLQSDLAKLTRKQYPHETSAFFLFPALTPSPDSSAAPTSIKKSRMTVPILAIRISEKWFEVMEQM